MKKIIAIKRNDNGVTWLSGPEEFKVDDVNQVSVRYLVDRFGVTVEHLPASGISGGPSNAHPALMLKTRKGQQVFFPVDKIESVELRNVTDDAYNETCGE